MDSSNLPWLRMKLAKAEEKLARMRRRVGPRETYDVILKSKIAALEQEALLLERLASQCDSSQAVKSRILGWIAKVNAKASKLQTKLDSMPELARGKYVNDLGTKPTTPCVEVLDKDVRRKIRRVVVQNTMGKRPRRANLCHRCDNPLCVAIDHFFWGTPGDNMRDAMLKGRLHGTADEKQVHLQELAVQNWRDRIEEVERVLHGDNPPGS